MWLSICKEMASYMRTLLKVFIIIGCLLQAENVFAQNEGYDVFIPISKYLAQGNTDNLSAWFADNLEISVISSSSNCSKNQAKQILRTFFESHTPRSFDITHTAGKSNMKYALGTLNAGGESYMVTIFASYSSDRYKIQQIKIERTQ